MKFRRLICLVLIIGSLFSLFACDNTKKDNDDSANQSTEPEDSAVVYVYSVLSKSIHLPTCHFVQSIKEDYKRESSDIMKLINDGYELCTFCFPPEKEEEPEEEEEEEEEIIQKIPYEQATYILNSKTFKIHEKGCRHLENLTPKNIEHTDLSYEELLELEYSPCGTCMPAEYKEYKETHPTED